MSFAALIVAFAGGFALAALVFWPLQRRAPRPGNSSRGSPSTGKHALERATTNPVGIPNQDRTDRKTGKGLPVAKHSVLGRSAAAKNFDRPPEENHDGMKPDEEFAPQDDLFDQHHAAKFDQARQRLAKVRLELGSS